MAKADVAARSSNCVRRAVGAVIVRQGKVISTGWNGVPEGKGDCREAGCPRCINGGDTGSGYETCICIHAEQRAIADAARRGVSTIDSTLYVNLRPCLQCLAIAKASGVREIFYGEDWKYSDEIEKVYRTLSGQFDCFSRVAEMARIGAGGSLELSGPAALRSAWTGEGARPHTCTNKSRQLSLTA
jgi:dCMP deaminase